MVRSYAITFKAKEGMSLFEQVENAINDQPEGYIVEAVYTTDENDEVIVIWKIDKR